MSTGSMDNRVATGESPAEADTLDSKTWSASAGALYQDREGDSQ